MARILVIDDERKLAAAIKRGLDGEGFSADVANEGAEGLWMAEGGSYDAIVLDLMLPGLDGSEICRRLRDAGNWTPILVLTARDTRRDEIRSLELGADDFLAKPFSFSVLVARLRALLRRGTNERPPLLEVGSLRLDPVSRRCSRHGVEIHLTGREFAVLEFFMRRVEHAVTRLDILDNVWDFSFEGDPNIVEVYVRRLRRKVDEPFGKRSIETVRGVGYRLAAADD